MNFHYANKGVWRTWFDVDDRQLRRALYYIDSYDSASLDMKVKRFYSGQNIYMSNAILVPIPASEAQIG